MEEDNENMDILSRIKDAHYFQLSSQGNVYTLTSIQLANGTNKILAATLKREVFCFEYPDTISDILTPTTKEVLFTYIPGVAEIISIDAFNKSQTENDIVIGITITKSGNNQPRENYLNIYSAWEATADFNLESIAQNCLSVELGFIPYLLYHTNLPAWNENGQLRNEIIWLLSGSDERIHMFQEHGANRTFKEVELGDCFPELINSPSVVMWMDIKYYNNFTRRITVYGCECGYLNVSIVDTKSLVVIKTHSIVYENTISSVQIFKMEPTLKSQLFNDTSDDIYNLLIVNSNFPSVVCMNVFEDEPKTYELLGSNYFNVASCSCVADIDFDGNNEILIGTYGQELLVYKYVDDNWKIKGIKTFSHPIYSLMYMDVTGDGINEIICLTMKGVHILQHNQTELEELLEKKLKIYEQNVNFVQNQ